MPILYRHIRLDKNEPFYIGIGNKLNRAYSKSGRNDMWNKVVNKTDYEVEILFDDLTWDEACEKEKEFISLYGRKSNNTGTLVNLCDGGEGSINYKFKEESKKIMSLKKIGVKTAIKIDDKTLLDLLSNGLTKKQISNNLNMDYGNICRRIRNIYTNI